MYPSVEKDVSFVLPQNIKAEAVKKEMAKLAGDMLKNITVIDKYEGAPLKQGERSVAFRMQFQKNDRTLSDEEVNLVFNKVIDGAQHKLPIILR